MPINPDAVGASGGPVKRSWTSKDALLYAVGVGAGRDELRFSTENTKELEQKVLPTFAVIIGGGGMPLEQLGSFNHAMLVHGEQSVELYGEIPIAGEIESTSTITGIYDKGSAAVVEMESTSIDTATEKLLMKTRTGLFIKGEGGWGGNRGANTKFEFPQRAADHIVSYKTSEDQALIYRLSGDRNPLHSDPAFAAAGGFEQPILHGLCTWGYTGRALLHTICRGEASRFKSMSSRFSKPVIPGDQLTVSIWVEGKTALFHTATLTGDIVIDQGRCSFIP
jgi:acyl dehydratase